MRMVTGKQKGHPEEWPNCLFLLVPMTGVELVTFALRMRKSTCLLVLIEILQNAIQHIKNNKIKILPQCLC